MPDRRSSGGSSRSGLSAGPHRGDGGHHFAFRAVDAAGISAAAWQGTLSKPAAQRRSGEELSPSLQNRCLAALPRARLSNLYGPTECAVDVTAWECVADADCRRVPIGRPIANTQIYILDERLEPVLAGTEGEIFIGGVAVGRGYWNRPDLTAERFVADPFSPSRKARMYKTGDLGRWRPDGAVEYLGRNDYQVKIRGFRIELGEIEAQLARTLKWRKRSCWRGTTRRARRAWWPISCRGISRLFLDSSSCGHTLRLFCRIIWCRARSCPYRSFRRRRTANWIARHCRRPTPHSFLRRPYHAPQGQVEEALAGIWQALLGVERIGRDENFFELGGHSLSLGLRSRMQDQLGIEIRSARSSRRRRSSVWPGGLPRAHPAIAWC